MITLAVVEKQKDLRPLLRKVKEFDADDIPNAWELYKKNLRDQELAKAPKVQTPTAQNGFLQTAINQTGQVLQSIVGGAGISVKRPSLAAAHTLIDKLELGCSEIRKSIAKEYKNFLELEKKYIKDHQDRMKQQIEELETKEYKLIDYLMGTVPPIGAEEPPK
jgi:prefoldin subunit 5